MNKRDEPMTLPSLIEAKSAEFDMKWNPLKPIPQKDGESVKKHFISSLKEAYLAGIEAAGGCVPEEVPEHSIIHTRDNIQMNSTELSLTGNRGFNQCRAETLSSLSKLKEQSNETTL